MTFQRAARHLAAAGILLAGCATSSSSNFRVDYRAVGPTNEAAPLNKAAETAFSAAATTEAQKKAISSVKVYMDSLPPQLTAKDNVIAVADGVPAVLVGSVELTAVWKTPSDDQVIPVIQKGGYAAGADVAFCPRQQKPAAHVWRCYLARTNAPASDRANDRRDQ